MKKGQSYLLFLWSGFFLELGSGCGWPVQISSWSERGTRERLRREWVWWQGERCAEEWQSKVKRSHMGRGKLRAKNREEWEKWRSGRVQGSSLLLPLRKSTKYSATTATSATVRKKNNVENHKSSCSKVSNRSVINTAHTQTENTHCRCRCRKTLLKSGILWCPRWLLLPWQWEPVQGSGSTACWSTPGVGDK